MVVSWRSGVLAFVMLVVAGLAPERAWAKDGLTIGETATVVGTEGRGLRMRSGPGMSHRIVRTAAEGVTVQVLAGPVSDGDEDWYQLSVSGTSTGWGIGRYLVSDGNGNGNAASLPGDGGQRTFVARMTAYSNGVGGVPKNATTATGTKTRYGVVAVDPKLVPLGSTLTIEGYDGIFVAEDTGGAIKGPALDIWLPDPAQAKRYGTQYRRVTILSEGARR